MSSAWVPTRKDNWQMVGFILAVVALSAAFSYWITPRHTVHASQPDRFTEIYWQYSDRAQVTFEVFHDNETGQEIICTEDRGTTCYLSGRAWKTQ